MLILFYALLCYGACSKNKKKDHSFGDQFHTMGMQKPAE